MKNRTARILLLSSLLFFSACYYDKEQLLTPPGTGTGTSACQNFAFAANVSPIIMTSCSASSGCHGTGSSSGPGALTTYTEIKNAAAQIQSSIMAGRMPLGSSLSAAQLQTINCWINNGTPNN